MKKTFTKKFGKTLLTAAFAVMTATNASAGESWSAFYNKVIAYPTGAGKVYISESDTTVAETEYADEMEMQVKQMTANYGWAYLYGQPADGWILHGFSTATVNEDGTASEFAGNIDYYDNPASVTTYSTIVSEGDSDAGTSGDSTAIDYPLDPNNVFYAVFTHVAARYVPGQETLGTITVSNPANNIGETVTLTATPSETDSTAKFEKWTLNGEVVSTEPSFTVEVTGIAEYVAHFTSDYADNVTFPEEGGYRFMYADSLDYTLPSTVTAYYFYPDSLNLNSVDGDDNTINQFEAGYYVSATNPVIVYGKGEVTYTYTNADMQYTYTDESNMLRVVGENDILVSSLDATSTSYYIFDTETGVFTLAEAGDTLKGYTSYLALPDTCYSTLGAAPKTIYLNPNPVAAGINEVSVSKKAASGIYNLNGIRQNAVNGNGIYIIDGKKVLFRRK